MLIFPQKLFSLLRMVASTMCECMCMHIFQYGLLILCLKHFFCFMRFHYLSKRLELFGLFGADVPVMCSELQWCFGISGLETDSST